MKYFFTFLAAVLLSLSAAAQAPVLFNYQAILRDTNGGALIANRTVTMRISILQGSAAGAAVFVERHTPTTNINGLVTLDIGGGTVLGGALNNLAWSKGNYFLKVETDPIGNVMTPNYTIVATSKLLSVPYAMYANQAGHSIGELFGGGVIFYLWRDSLGAEHGLVASLNDLAVRTPWGGSGTTTNAQSPRNGAANTAAIVSVLGANSAAGLCDAYVSGTFTDWYLPANWELSMLYNQAIAVNESLDNDNDSATVGLLEFGAYLSSTEKNSTEAFALSIRDGILSSTAPKTANNAVRAVRRF